MVKAGSVIKLTIGGTSGKAASSIHVADNHHRIPAHKKIAAPVKEWRFKRFSLAFEGS